MLDVLKESNIELVLCVHKHQTFANPCCTSALLAMTTWRASFLLRSRWVLTVIFLFWSTWFLILPHTAAQTVRAKSTATTT